jgi:hypothetical protein
MAGRPPSLDVRTIYRPISLSDAAKTDAYSASSKIHRKSLYFAVIEGGKKIALYPPGGRVMRYLLAWMLGVPGVLIFIWFCMAHC